MQLNSSFVVSMWYCFTESSCYKVGSSLQVYTYAKELCQENFAELVTITDEFEQAFVFSLVRFSVSINTEQRVYHIAYTSGLSEIFNWYKLLNNIKFSFKRFYLSKIHYLQNRNFFSCLFSLSSCLSLFKWLHSVHGASASQLCTLMRSSIVKIFNCNDSHIFVFRCSFLQFKILMHKK